MARFIQEQISKVFRERKKNQRIQVTRRGGQYQHIPIEGVLYLLFTPPAREACKFHQNDFS